MSIIQYKAASNLPTSRPSPKIWADCPVIAMLKDPGKGVHIFEDFHYLNCDDADNVLGHFWNFQNTSSTLALIPDVKGVVRFLNAGDTDNDYACLSSGDNLTGILRTPKKGTQEKFWFEARIRTNTITTDDQCIYIGFAEVNKSGGTGLIADSTAVLADVDYLGFYVDDGDGNDITIVANEASSGTAVSDTGEIELEVDTWIRIGFKYDPLNEEIRVFKDGVDQGDDAAIDVTSIHFPSDTSMSIYLLSKAMGGKAATDRLDIDWVRFAQEYRS